LAIKAFVVGGAVRDQLLGLAVQDRDWVVVGSTPEEMIAAGFKPVGKDFPVFIHPVSGEEYALARTERKTAKGYHGFAFQASPNITLEEDLSRRDLTINAMAQASDLVDPFGGTRDLKAKIFRHVSPAFAEDPVRILRLARFAARFPEFTVHPTTLKLMQQMVAAGEVDALVHERVWQEFSRGLMESKPSRMLEVLQSCGALPKVLMTIDDEALAQCNQLLDQSAHRRAKLSVRFALLAPLIGIEKLDSLRLPAEVLDLSLHRLTVEADLLRCDHSSAKAVATMLQRCDVIRRPDRFQDLLEVIAIVLPQQQKSMEFWPIVATSFASVNAGQIAAKLATNNGELIKGAVARAREDAVKSALLISNLPTKP
jgi:tRNA nucleotidyltransferase (CCA-adding enzyme)